MLAKARELERLTIKNMVTSGRRLSMSWNSLCRKRLVKRNRSLVKAGSRFLVQTAGKIVKLDAIACTEASVATNVDTTRNRSTT
jgi:predicted dinucleotide-utilizing enzyme